MKKFWTGVTVLLIWNGQHNPRYLRREQTGDRWAAGLQWKEAALLQKAAILLKNPQFYKSDRLTKFSSTSRSFEKFLFVFFVC